jgi:hypothetical protein
MEIDITEMHNLYETLSKNAFELFWEINQNQTFKCALAEEPFNVIVQDSQIFGNEIWTAISGLCNNAECKGFLSSQGWI